MEYRPPGHAVHGVTPSPENCPAAQTLHAALPVTFAKVPGTQVVQFALLVVPLNVPTGQGVQTTAPGPEYCPLAHSEHVDRPGLAL